MAINVRYWALATLLAPALAFAFAAFPEQLTEDSRAVRDTAQSFGRAADGVFSQEFGERERLRGDIESGAAKRQDAFNVSNEDRALYQKQQEGLGISEEKRRERIKAQLRGFVAQLAQELQEKNYPIPPSELSRQQRVVEESVSVKGRTVCLDFRGLNVRGDKPCVTLEENEVELNAARHSAFFQRLAALLYEENNQVLAALQANGDFVASASESVSSSESSRALAGGSSFGSNSPVGWAKDVDVDRIETQLSQGGKFESEARVENAGGATIKGKDTPVENFVNELPSYNGSYSPPAGAVPSAPSNNVRPSGGESLQRAPAMARSAPNLPVAPIRNTQSAAPAHQNKAIPSAPKDDPASRAPTRNLADSGSTPKDNSSQADLLCAYLGGKYCGGNSGTPSTGVENKSETYVNSDSLKSYFRSNKDVQAHYKTLESFVSDMEQKICKAAETRSMTPQEICESTNNMFPDCKCEDDLRDELKAKSQTLEQRIQEVYAQHSASIADRIDSCRRGSDTNDVEKRNEATAGSVKSATAPKRNINCNAVARTAVVGNLIAGKFPACRLLNRKPVCDFAKSRPACVNVGAKDLSGVTVQSKNQEETNDTLRKGAMKLLLGANKQSRDPAAKGAAVTPDILAEYIQEKTSFVGADTSTQSFDGWPVALQAMADRYKTSGVEKYAVEHLLYNLSTCQNAGGWRAFLKKRREALTDEIAAACADESQKKLPSATERAEWGCDDKFATGCEMADALSEFKERLEKMSRSKWRSLRAEATSGKRVSINKEDVGLCERLWREANLIDTLQPFGHFYRHARHYKADGSSVAHPGN